MLLSSSRTARHTAAVVTSPKLHGEVPLTTHQQVRYDITNILTATAVRVDSHANDAAALRNTNGDPHVCHGEKGPYTPQNLSPSTLGRSDAHALRSSSLSKHTPVLKVHGLVLLS